MPALLALIPLKDWLWAALVAALIAGVIYERNHLIAEGAAHEIAALQASSAKLQAAAEARVQQLAADYAATVVAHQETFDAQTQVANAQLSDAAKRVSDYDAYRRSHQTVGGPASAAAIAGSGKSGPSGVDDQFASLEQVALQLASSTAHSVIALNMCMVDRDSLTGK